MLNSIVIAAVGFVCLALLAPRATAQGPCCVITAINQQTGIVTARVNATGQVFQFKPASQRLLQAVKVGQGLYANFNTRQVSMDGKTPGGTIVSIGPAKGPAMPATPERAPSVPPAPRPESSTKSPTGPSQPASSAPPSGANRPCCSITAIDTRKNLASAKENGTARIFQFKANNPTGIDSLTVGEGIYANFRSMQVSLDGKNIFGAIVNLGPGGSNTTAGQVPQGGKPKSAQVGAGKSNVARPQHIELPKLAFGPLQPVHAAPLAVSQFRTGAVPYTRFATVGSATLVHLHGLGGIRDATGLPQGVKDFLFLHARTLPPNEVDNYIVNVQLAQQWFQTHPEPDFVKQAAADAMSSGDSHAGCNVLSVHCLGEAVQHASYEAARQSEALRQAAGDEWRHITGQAKDTWEQVEGCFSDQTLDPVSASFQFSIAPQFSLPFQASSNTKNSVLGSASGQISGNVTFGLPLNGSFDAKVEAFYIPCLPFAIRPKSIGGNGTLGAGATFNATLTASGQFQQSFTIPPGGGARYPIYVTAITIAGVPIAELDISVYLDGTVAVDGNGSLNGNINLRAQEETAFDFNCDGGSCGGGAHRVSVPDTAAESVQVNGRIHVRPAVYAALQLDLDVDLLSARAGPEPYLYGEIYGCVAASGSQSSGGGSTSQEFNALTADLDWGIDLRAEVLAGGDKLWGNKWDITNGHLLFKDLAHSNALIPSVAGSQQPALGQAAAYKVKMPTCYPYTDELEYQLQWTGGATATSPASPPNPGTPSKKTERISPVDIRVNARQPAGSNFPATCSLQAAQADCWSDPLQDLPFNLAWPAAGNFNLIITPVRDKHGRAFDSSDAAQVNVIVQ